MKSRAYVLVLLSLAVFVDLDAPPIGSIASAQCRRTCPPSWRRDADGCCLGPPEAAPDRGAVTARPQCGEGEHRSAGHCCPAGSDWVPARRRCICTEPPCGGESETASASPPPPREDPPAPAAAFQCPPGAVAVPGGSFWMGSAEDEGEDDEHPSHEVTLGNFCLDAREVSVEQYLACMRAGRCSPPASTIQVQGWSQQAVSAMSAYCNGTREDRMDHPVNCVTWNQATQYCAWRGARLPTEAEWEYAARGSDRRLYPWGGQLPDARLANACGEECEALPVWGRGRVRGVHEQDDGWEATAPVTAFGRGRTPLGILNLGGNVWEWTADYHGTYPSEPAQNAGGPRSGSFRVARGGAWTTRTASWLRAAARNRVRPDDRNSDLGLRCASGPVESSR